MEECEEPLEDFYIYSDKKFVLEEYMNLLCGFNKDGLRVSDDLPQNMGAKLSSLKEEASIMISDSATSSCLFIIFCS